MAKMAASVLESGEDAFRKVFKFYKRRDPPPDLRNVTDFSTGTGEKIVPVELDHSAVKDEEAASVGLQPVRTWRAFSLQGHPGFIFISNPFLRGSQAFWVRQCLKTYPQKPNVCNLDMHMSSSDTQDIWAKSAQVLRSPPFGKRQSKTLLEKLRWVTLGYHYNWDTKTYSASNYTPFPADLHELSLRITAACGFLGFNSEAAILNFYRSDSSLGIHVDESELDHSRPLLSFSFGQTAIFLLGGPRRQDSPTAMFMHSGDVMVMSGPSRLLYHAVPRILPAPQERAEFLENTSSAFTLQPDRFLELVTEEDWIVCSRYIQNSRVNMTVRQVLGPGQTFPETPPSSLEKNTKVQRDRYHDRAAEGDSGMKKRSRSDSDAAETTET